MFILRFDPRLRLPSYIYIYIYIYLTTAIGLTPGGSVVVRTISIHRTTQTITEQIQITATQ